MSSMSLVKMCLWVEKTAGSKYSISSTRIEEKKSD